MDICRILSDYILAIKERCDRWLENHEEIDLSQLSELTKNLTQEYVRKIKWNELNQEYYERYEWGLDHLKNRGLKCRKCGLLVGNHRLLPHYYENPNQKLFGHGQNIHRLDCRGYQGDSIHHFKVFNYHQRYKPVERFEGIRFHERLPDCY